MGARDRVGALEGGDAVARLATEVLGEASHRLGRGLAVTLTTTPRVFAFAFAFGLDQGG